MTDSRPKIYHRSYICIAGLLVAAFFCVSLLVGRYPLSIKEIAAILLRGDADATARAVFFTLRLPRAVMAVLAGAGLGLAGSVFQLIFKNPLAAPDIIGVSSGANLGAAFAILLFGHSAAIMAGTAFLGGMLSMFLVAALARRSGGGNTVAFILAGIIMKSLCDAGIMTLKYFADTQRQLASMEYWSMGSLSNITATKLGAVLPFFLVGFIGIVLLRRQIALLGLEDDESRALGVRIKYVRVAVIAFCALTVSAVVCVTGPIAFIGLIAPHVARLALKRISFAWCVLSVLTGALIMLVSDMPARSFAVEIPIGILTTLAGIPILLVFLWRRKAGKI